jgi:surface carbohydrate biosynthesis protein
VRRHRLSESAQLNRLRVQHNSHLQKQFEKLRNIILPSETQSREFDAKLLLACALADLGAEVIVGSRVEIHNAIHRLPRGGLYVAKDFRTPSNRIFNILKGFGHAIVAWDEEAILFFNQKEFHERRVHAPTLGMVEQLFAWGPENAGYLRSAPGYHSGVPIHIFGNPRIDMLRPELRHFYDTNVAELRRRYGSMILINSNFGKLNHAVSKYVVKPGGKDASVGGKINPFMERAWTHRMKIFESFKSLVGFLSTALPGHSIIVRPHPAENHQTWKDVGRGMSNVHVVHEGPVQNWLLAADAMIHNSCTTGIEGYLLGSPVISYQPFRDEAVDLQLSNNLGRAATTQDEVLTTISEFASKGTSSDTPNEKTKKLGQYLSGLDGPLATDQIARVLSVVPSGRHHVALAQRTHAELDARIRSVTKKTLAFLPDHKNSRIYSKQRFPDLEVAEVKQKIQSLSTTLDRFHTCDAVALGTNIFRIFNRQ